jgi:hypothetical protein
MVQIQIKFIIGIIPNIQETNRKKEKKKKKKKKKKKNKKKQCATKEAQVQNMVIKSMHARSSLQQG